MNNMIGILRELWRLRNRDYIPPTASGYSVPYSHIDEDSRRVMARMGIRSPAGLNRALKRAGVTTVDELMIVLKHHRPKRRIIHRFNRMLDRIFGGFSRPPHSDEIRILARRTETSAEIDQRVNKVVELMKK